MFQSGSAIADLTIYAGNQLRLLRAVFSCHPALQQRILRQTGNAEGMPLALAQHPGNPRFRIQYAEFILHAVVQRGKPTVHCNRGNALGQRDSLKDL